MPGKAKVEVNKEKNRKIVEIIRGKTVEKAIWVRRNKKVNKNSLSRKIKTQKTNKNQNHNLPNQFLLLQTKNQSLNHKNRHQNTIPTKNNNSLQNNSNKTQTITSQYALPPHL